MSGPSLPEIINSSYGLHSEDARKAMAELHDKGGDTDFLNFPKLVEVRNTIPIKLAYYKAELARTNPASFRFLTAKQLERLKDKLLLTYTLLLSQYTLDEIYEETEKRKSILAGHRKSLELCSKRIREINLALRGDKPQLENDLESEINSYTGCLRYIGWILLGPWLVEKAEEFMEGGLGTLKGWLSEINSKRLYWVWGGGLLSSVLEMLPESFFNAIQARETLDTVAPISGYMSWILYFTRLFINLYYVAKHTIAGPWMSEEESKTPPWERFKTQWNLRKYEILNDVLWAPINMACFFWLRGKGFGGYAGGIATIILLSADLILTTLRYWEEATNYEAEMDALRKDIGRLQDKKNKPGADLAELNEQIKELEETLITAEFEWKYKELALLNDCSYALGLLLAFCIFICFFCPPATLAPMTVMIIGICGAAACFLCNTIYAAISGGLEISKAEELGQRARDKCTKEKGVLKKFEVELAKPEDESLNMRKLLFLEMKALMAESAHQERLATFQLIKAIRSTLIDAFFPVVVFVSLLFLASGAGVPIIAAALAIGIYTDRIINELEPKAAQLPEFNEGEYKEFEDYFKVYKENSLSFFERKEKSGSRCTLFNSNQSSKSTSYIPLDDLTPSHP